MEERRTTQNNNNVESDILDWKLDFIDKELGNSYVEYYSSFFWSNYKYVFMLHFINFHIYLHF